MLQVTDTSLYVVTAVVIYRYAGADVESPALSSAGKLMSRIAYGLAIPTVRYPGLRLTLLLILEQVIIAGVIFGHVAAKYVYVRIWRGSSRMHEKSFVSIGSWVAINLTGWIIAWVIAESIPVFNDLLSLIVRSSSDCAHFANTYIQSALFGSWISCKWPATSC